MRVWNALYFKKGDFKPNVGKSSAWNRGDSWGHAAPAVTEREVKAARSKIFVNKDPN
jgi:hypothetical protein